MPTFLDVHALTPQAFAAFGDVIDTGPAGTHYAINEGTAERFHDLARIDTTRSGGRTVVSIFRAQARPLPLQVQLVERHLLGSQAFMPLGAQRFLVVVAAAGAAPDAAALRCFLAAPGQGVNFAAGTWHHPLLALDGGGDFLVIDRVAAGAQADCEEHALPGPPIWVHVGAAGMP